MPRVTRKGTQRRRKPQAQHRLNACDSLCLLWEAVRPPRRWRPRLCCRATSNDPRSMAVMPRDGLRRRDARVGASLTCLARAVPFDDPTNTSRRQPAESSSTWPRPRRMPRDLGRWYGEPALTLGNTVNGMAVHALDHARVGTPGRPNRPAPLGARRTSAFAEGLISPIWDCIQFCSPTFANTRSCVSRGRLLLGCLRECAVKHVRET